MFSKSQLTLVALSLLSLSDVSFARTRWLERDGRSVQLYPRRFSQEHPDVLNKLASACPGQVCGNLAGQAVTPLLAAQPECSQQDMADSIIDAAQQFDAATKANMISLAVEYRQAEKNTPPDFTTNPPTNRNSVFCQKAPKNAELNGLVQAQDPANDPNLFFDPATGASVTKGSQANTFPFGTSGSSSSNSTAAASSVVASSAVSSSTAASASAAATSAANLAVVASSSADPCIVTVTVTAVSSASAAATEVASATLSSSAAAATSTASSASIGDFGSCSVPQIEFGAGFDNRKETSFEPVDKTSYNHGSAQNIDIITQFMCDQLVNSCGADATAKATCASAKTAADTKTAKTGAQADAFNAVFGITTNFAAVTALDDQGQPIAGSATGSSDASASASSVAATESATESAVASTTANAAAVQTSAAASGSGIGNFGSCSVPQIEFGAGFDNRKETSFEPVDKTSYNHGSAQNIDIITQFMCDQLVNSCGADATAKATCATAKTAADTKTAKTGAQADAFNAVFGITTNFAAVTALDDQGQPIAGSATGSDNAASASAAPAAASTTAAATSAATSAATTKAAVTSSAAAAAATSAAATSGQNLQTFTGALGGVTPPAVTASGAQFQVDGNSAFNNLSDALTRSCDVQHNQCANAANASGNKGDLTVAACGDQQTQCDAAH
ncbi:hypothetical protein PsYK624_047270 [Phanerochaete sordida]|uniref:Uncharacterized protein n=1 Tax=Phanerochaete sordida TaxID=48140 RepID=A0A9P3LBK3_9APHY|nr:hypothetical protein PsYK624_047270 [Phanerochaete sordida]